MTYAPANISLFMNAETADKAAANAIGTCAAQGPINAHNLPWFVQAQTQPFGWKVPTEIPAHVIERAAGRYYDALSQWIKANAR